VGGEDRDIHFDSMQWGQGASMALPIWAIYMKKVLADDRLPYDTKMSFEVPDNFDPCSASDVVVADSIDGGVVVDEDTYDIDELYE
jgi:penicillin-binding protein 1A